MMELDISVQWKDTGNDIVSDLSLEVLRVELLELMEIFEQKSKKAKENKDKGDIYIELDNMMLSLLPNEFENLYEILNSLIKKTPDERKKFKDIYPETISKRLSIIYNILSTPD